MSDEFCQKGKGFQNHAELYTSPDWIKRLFFCKYKTRYNHKKTISLKFKKALSTQSISTFIFSFTISVRWSWLCLKIKSKRTFEYLIHHSIYTSSLYKKVEKQEFMVFIQAIDKHNYNFWRKKFGCNHISKGYRLVSLFSS